jgi:hypothetical protein
MAAIAGGRPSGFAAAGQGGNAAGFAMQVQLRDGKFL